METDTDFRKELDKYLKLIQYDESQVYEEINQALQKCLEEESKKFRKM